MSGSYDLLLILRAAPTNEEFIVATVKPGSEGAPTGSGGKNAPIVKQGQTPGTKYGQGPAKESKAK